MSRTPTLTDAVDVNTVLSEKDPLPDTSSDEQAQQQQPSIPFSGGFFDATPDAKLARGIYLKIIGLGTTLIMCAIFCILGIYWGALWETTPRVHNMQGWIVDFDGGSMGAAVIDALPSFKGTHFVSWQIKNASDFPNGPSDLAYAVVDEHCQTAISINPGATSNFLQAVASVDASYNASLAATAYGNEARNENAYRTFVRANLDGILQHAATTFAEQSLKQLHNNTNLGAIALTAPHLLTQPLYYTINNLRPFDTSVATTVTFVGLIYLLILAFIIANVSAAARMVTGLERRLSLSSLIRVRLVTPVVAYFFVSLMYSLLSLAFKLPFSRKFGHSGFLVFWMLQYLGMIALGLALEAMITILTVKFVPFFMLLWVISNVSVCVLPIEVLPEFYRYGHAAPFYNIAMAVRTIVFSTKDRVGLNFGILIVWTTISCITIPLSVWFLRRRELAAHRRREAEEQGF